MTATEDYSNVTAMFLIQPASYLQYGQAAYPANLSFGVEIYKEISISALLAYAFARKDRSPNLSNICTKQL